MDHAHHDARTFLVLYASETGNGQDLAFSLGQVAQRLHFDTAVEEMNAADLSSLLRPALVVFIVSTTGQGDFPRNGLVLWRKLLRKRLPPACLSRLRFGMFGLGDSSYPRFNWAARKLHKRLGQLGAQEFYARAEGDERHSDGIDTAWLPWLAALRAHLLAGCPLPPSLRPIPDDALLPTRYSLAQALAQAQPPEPPAALSSPARPPEPPTAPAPAPAQSSESPMAPSDPPPPPPLPLPIPDSVPATLLSNTRVTPASHFQDVRLITLALPAAAATPNTPPVTPGDCVTIFPTNPAAAVTKLLDLMGWAAVADLPLTLPALLPAGFFSPPATTLRAILTRNLDITAVPRRSFLGQIAHFAADPTHRGRLLEFADPRLADELYDYTTRPRRTILEVLDEFHSVRIPAERVLDVFPVLRGRDFSICNCPGPSFSPAPPPGSGSGGPSSPPSSSPGPITVEILVALVRYRTILRVPREGLCSRYLAPLAAGAPLQVVHKPALTAPCPPAFSSRPVVAIAAGTGVAPIRAMVQSRRQRGDRGDTVLIFGCRNREADFYFADEWAAAAAAEGSPAAGCGGGRLQVIPAFSRDQREKVYVQDRIRAHAPLVASLVRQNAAFVLCGGSARMAEACKVVLGAALVAEGMASTEHDAMEMVARLDWWQEIWS